MTAHPRTLIMGVVNVTPDSFSDGGRYFQPERAIAHAHELIAQGADIIDIGGESTRPGGARTDADEELRRVLPVIRELAGASVPLSIDTMRAATASQAVAAGARYINDVSGGLADPNMFAVAAETRAPFVLMHWRGHLGTVEPRTHYTDTVTDVRAELEARVDAALDAGAATEQLILDPGLGFSKHPQHNWELVAGLQRLREIGFPLLVGASRKRFLAHALNPDNPASVSESTRDEASAALTAILATAQVWGVRVHAVRSARIAARIAELSGRHQPGPAGRGTEMWDQDGYPQGSHGPGADKPGHGRSGDCTPGVYTPKYAQSVVPGKDSV